MSRKPKKINTVEQRYKTGEPFRKNMVRILFFINAVFWLGYSIYVYYDMAVVNKNLTSADIATVFSFVIVIFLFASGIVLGKFKKSPYYFSVFVAVLNFILCLPNVQDNFYLISFIINIATLWLLYNLRKSYLSKL